MKKHFGCSGFYYDEWKEKFYPEDVKKKEWLEYYAKHFDTVEINATFYRLPQEKTFKGWHDRTPENFRFTVKGSRYITHLKRLKNDQKMRDGVKTFYDAISPLKGKLGCILWQLPGNIHANKDKLRGFFDQLEQNYENVIEFRHESWFDDEIYKILSDYKVSFCILSAPGNLPSDLIETTDTAYIRFHGKENWYSDNYTDSELKDWAKKIKSLKAKKVWVYFNNDVNAYAVKNCKTLREMIE